jgi:hypothetical protein
MTGFIRPSDYESISTLWKQNTPFESLEELENLNKGMSSFIGSSGVEGLGPSLRLNSLKLLENLNILSGYLSKQDDKETVENFKNKVVKLIEMEHAIESVKTLMNVQV